jgi:hypothetical protein
VARKVDDGAGRPEYWTSEQLATVILFLSQYAPIDIPDDVEDCIAWAAHLVIDGAKNGPNS